MALSKWAETWDTVVYSPNFVKDLMASMAPDPKLVDDGPVQYSSALPEFLPARVETGDWDLDKFFDKFEVELQRRGLRRSWWLPRLRAQTRDQRSRLMVDFTIVKAIERRAPSLYEAVKDAFFLYFENRYGPGAYFRALVDRISPEGIVVSSSGLVTDRTEIQTWMYKYEKARQRAIRHKGGTVWPPIPEEDQAFLELLYMFCLTPPATRQSITVRELKDKLYEI